MVVWLGDRYMKVLVSFGVIVLATACLLAGRVAWEVEDAGGTDLKGNEEISAARVDPAIHRNQEARPRRWCANQ